LVEKKIHLSLSEGRGTDPRLLYDGKERKAFGIIFEPDLFESGRKVCGGQIVRKKKGRGGGGPVKTKAARIRTDGPKLQKTSNSFGEK